MCIPERGATLARMTCSHCRREVAGVAVIFPAKPPVCGRADCLGWARAVMVEVPGADGGRQGGLNGRLAELAQARIAAADVPTAA